MARQIISVGSAANDGTGDTLRQAAQKINETFVEIYQKFGGDSNILSSVVSIDGTGIVVNLGTTFTLTATTPPASNRVILLPDANGTVTLNEAAQTLLQKTLVSPTITNPAVSGVVNDSNGNEIIRLFPTASAVNEIGLTNAATGNSPTVSATGTDTNIDLTLNSKGGGSVVLRKSALSAVTISTDGAASPTASYIICNKGTALALSLADGTTVGEQKVFTNRGAGLATITPTSFAPGTSFSIAQNKSATVIWDGSNWYLTGGYDVSVT